MQLEVSKGWLLGEHGDIVGGRGGTDTNAMTLPTRLFRLRAIRGRESLVPRPNGRCVALMNARCTRCLMLPQVDNTRQTVISAPFSPCGNLPQFRPMLPARTATTSFASSGVAATTSASLETRQRARSMNRKRTRRARPRHLRQTRAAARTSAHREGTGNSTILV